MSVLRGGPASLLNTNTGRSQPLFPFIATGYTQKNRFGDSTKFSNNPHLAFYRQLDFSFFSPVSIGTERRMASTHITVV